MSTIKINGKYPSNPIMGWLIALLLLIAIYAKSNAQSTYCYLYQEANQKVMNNKSTLCDNPLSNEELVIRAVELMREYISNGYFNKAITVYYILQECRNITSPNLILQMRFCLISLPCPVERKSINELFTVVTKSNYAEDDVVTLKN